MWEVGGETSVPYHTLVLKYLRYIGDTQASMYTTMAVYMYRIYMYMHIHTQEYTTTDS